MRVVGLFSGIGGIELPFHEAGHETALLCDIWDASQTVLRHRFPGVPVVGDIREVTGSQMPPRVDVLTAGFPCTDLSQAGRTAGIAGEQSGLVAHVFRILDEHEDIQWLVLENVRNMLVLDQGEAMRYLVDELTSRGFRWAYRLVDSRFTGVPQRRHRVILVASRHHDPREVLFADNAEPRPADEFADDAFGFYWTEGERGLGWARDAVPPLKGGSTIGIPSPPAIWLPRAEDGRRLLYPTIEQAEAMQGFPRGWTEPATSGRKNGPRWKLVGNAVTVGVGRWIADRLGSPAAPVVETEDVPGVGRRWPDAAWGDATGSWVVEATQWPRLEPRVSLLDVVDPAECNPMTQRAAAGFLTRAERGSLNFTEGFLDDVRAHTMQFTFA
jgi:DNA (cytosine-5)-methyltransferase 1